MLFPSYGISGMAVAPHSLASQSALAVLREGGNALEAMVAAAACIAVVYPHMNALGGDGFWLVVPPAGEPLGIEACGPAGSLANPEFYRARGHAAIPQRGPLAANTVAGTVGGWEEALTLAAERGGRLPLQRILADATRYAREGVPVTLSQHQATRDKRAELEAQPGFAHSYLPGGKPPEPGSRFQQPELAATLEELAREGLGSFYRGPLAARLGAALEAAGSPVTREDLAAFRARRVEALALPHSRGTVYNFPPPTQGVASLLILGILDRLDLPREQDAAVDFVHLSVEATKRAFLLRNRHVTDPEFMSLDARSLLDPALLAAEAAAVDRSRAAAWGRPGAAGDTIWMGVVDGSGLAVSFIQSIYHEFGSGVVLGDTGVLWQNRGSSFSLEQGHLLELRPGKKPFHTLNPAAARLSDGRTMVYGTMGGDGQPQTQAAVFNRYVHCGLGLQAAVTAPRWLLGRTWGKASDSLKVESRMDTSVIEALRRRGHAVDLLDAFDESAGHAGAVVRYPGGVLEGAADPRSNGLAAGF